MLSKLPFTKFKDKDRVYIYILGPRIKSIFYAF